MWVVLWHLLHLYKFEVSWYFSLTLLCYSHTQMRLLQISSRTLSLNLRCSRTRAGSIFVARRNDLSPLPIVPLFDLVRLLVGELPKNFGPLNKLSVQLRATILNIDSVLPLLSALPSYTTGCGCPSVDSLRTARRAGGRTQPCLFKCDFKRTKKNAPIKNFWQGVWERLNERGTHVPMQIPVLNATKPNI